MADPFSIIVGIGGLVGLAIQVSERTSIVFQSGSKITSKFQRRRMQIVLFSSSLELLDKAATSHTCTVSGQRFLWDLRVVIHDCAGTIRDMKARFEELLYILDDTHSMLGKLKVRAKLLYIDSKLDGHEQVLEQSQKSLNIGVQTMQSYFASPVGSDEIRLASMRPLIQRKSVNTCRTRTYVESDYHPIVITFRRLGIGRGHLKDKCAGEIWMHACKDLARKHATATLSSVAEKYSREIEYYSRKGMVFQISSGTTLKYLSKPHKPRGPPRHTRKSHRSGPRYRDRKLTAYSIVIDTREDNEPFSTWVDDLILWFVNGRSWKKLFWQHIRSQILGKHERPLRVEEKVQMLIHLLAKWNEVSRPVSISIRLLHEGPCFHTAWKADFSNFWYIMSLFPFPMLCYNMECMRIETSNGRNFHVRERSQTCMASARLYYSIVNRMEYTSSPLGGPNFDPGAPRYVGNSSRRYWNLGFCVWEFEEATRFKYRKAHKFPTYKSFGCDLLTKSPSRLSLSAYEPFAHLRQLAVPLVSYDMVKSDRY